MSERAAQTLQAALALALGGLAAALAWGLGAGRMIERRIQRKRETITT